MKYGETEVSDQTMRRSRGEPPPGKSQVATGFRNSGMEPPREAIEPLGSNCFSKIVCTPLCEIR